MNKWLKEPLLHFLLLGALLFGLYSLVNPDEASIADNRIVVSAGDIERLSANWANKRIRLPTEAELAMLVDSYIREEVYYREALALGLDRNDTILRRRMVQKMEVLTNDLADLSQPDETALNQYFQANSGKYELPARISFTHIYFSLDKHGERIFDDAGKTLIEVQSSDVPVTRAPDMGDPFMLPYNFDMEDSFKITRIFGQDFTQQIIQLEAGTWQGPIESGYGLHLVRINKKVEARLPGIATVINKVRTDWMFEQRQRINKEVYERFLKRYEVVVENLPDRPETTIVPVEGGKSS